MEPLLRVEEAITPLEKAAAELEASQPQLEHLQYTDDTQMMIGVAEALLDADDPSAEDYAQRFVSNYQGWRGYGRGARVTLECLGNGMDPEVASTLLFSDGSYGNGAAMRVAPIGLRFASDPEQLVAQARASSLPTHRHPLGVEGAVLLARAVGVVVEASSFDRQSYFTSIMSACTQDPYREKLDRARTIKGDEVASLGSGIEALESVPTALACFACWPDSFSEAVGNAILLGGDTDTVAAMTGALLGALLGESAIPSDWLAALEDEPESKGRSYIRDLADRLFASTSQVEGS